MAGGVGSRLFPVSTPEHPKQFLDLLGCGKSLIRLTYERFMELDPDALVWVVTSASYIHFVEEQIPEIPRERILAEPAVRPRDILLLLFAGGERYPRGGKESQE